MPGGQQHFAPPVVEGTLCHLHPVTDRLQLIATCSAALATCLLGFLLLLDSLRRGFHLLLFPLFHREDCAVFRAAPADPDVVEFRHEVFTAYFALTAGWFTHGHHLEPAPR